MPTADSDDDVGVAEIGDQVEAPPPAMEKEVSIVEDAASENEDPTTHFDDSADRPAYVSSAEPTERERSDQEEGEDDVQEQEPLPSPFTREFWKKSCYPHASLTPHDFLPLGFCIAAFFTTGYASWDCRYFKGANISFIGRNYGLWTVEDGLGKCQLWNALFFSYNLGVPLKAARFLSMFATLQGLGVTTVITQSLQFHAVSWGIGALLFMLFLVSVSSTSTYNMWTVFFLFSYIILTLIVRFLIVHPIPREISECGTKLLVLCLLGCSLYTMLTLVVLTSDFCTCKNISAAYLEGRDPGDPCSAHCHLGIAGGMMIGSSFLWLFAAMAVLKFGVQPELQEDSSHQHYAHYPKTSIRTRTFNAGTNLKQRACVLRRNFSRGGSKKELSNRSRDSSGENCEAEDTTGSKHTDEEMNELVDERSCIQKACCDYRITPRSRGERWGFWSFRIGLGLLVSIYVFFVTVQIGANRESRSAARAPSTTKYFTTLEVCAYDASDTSKPFITFPSKEAAVLANHTVAHCGNCGYCSNPQDIRTYVDTRETIAKTAKMCGPKAIFGPFEKLAECLEGRIGFSEPCTFCWAENMKSTASGCIFTCMTTLFTGFMSDNNVDGAGDRGWLNQCLFCDEKKSGPAFVTCSGVARRRLGIGSEIERNPKEQCTRMDIDWLNVDWEAQFPGTEERKDGLAG